MKAVCEASKTATNAKVSDALNKLIEKGYISTRTVVSYSGKNKSKKVTGLFTDWEKVENSGFLAQ